MEREGNPGPTDRRVAAAALALFVTVGLVLFVVSETDPSGGRITDPFGNDSDAAVKAWR